MDAINMGIGFGLWQQGMPDAATLFDYEDQAEAWGIDSVWLSDHMMGERSEVSIVPMMAAIAARTRWLKFGPSGMMLPLRHPIAVAKEVATLDTLKPTGERARKLKPAVLCFATSIRMATRRAAILQRFLPGIGAVRQNKCWRGVPSERRLNAERSYNATLTTGSTSLPSGRHVRPTS